VEGEMPLRLIESIRVEYVVLTPNVNEIPSNYIVFVFTTLLVEKEDVVSLNYAHKHNVPTNKDTNWGNFNIFSLKKFMVYGTPQLHQNCRVKSIVGNIKLVDGHSVVTTSVISVELYILDGLLL